MRLMSQRDTDRPLQSSSRRRGAGRPASTLAYVPFHYKFIPGGNGF